ncbi:hypothetical protein DWW31_10610 [Clostridium sp. AF15-17LB]|nr:hypothetical protein DWW31_10610 [Clostridium sp. AF15-17LB]
MKYLHMLGLYVNIIPVHTIYSTTLYSLYKIYKDSEGGTYLRGLFVLAPAGNNRGNCAIKSLVIYLTN